MIFNPQSPEGSGRTPELLALSRGIAVPALAAAFGRALAGFDDVLFDRAANAGAAQTPFLDGMRELRRRREDAAARFAAHLQQAWDALEAGTPLSAETVMARPGQQEAGLSLVSEHELESRLAVRNFAGVVLRDWKPVLARLDRRLACIAGLGALDADTNPIGPEHIGVAMHEAFGLCDLAAEVRLVLIKLCEREFAAQAGRIYRELDEHLAQSGVMPDISPLQRRDASARPAPVAGEPGADAGPAGDADPAGMQQPPAWARRFNAHWAAQADPQEGDAAGGSQSMILEALHELLAQSRDARGASATGAPEPRAHERPLSQHEMMSVLSLLQATPTETLRAAVGDQSESLAQRLKNEVLSGATRLGVDPGQARLDPKDEDAIDLVGMLFDVMLDERELEGRPRELIGRLVVPFVKVAMLDRRMFVQKTHPARRLLNSLAEACEGNTGQSQAERTLMGKVEEIVDRLIAGFNENLTIFLTLEEEFRDFLAQHRRRSEIAERRAAETQRGQEKLEMARARAALELEARVQDGMLPAAVLGFLREPWNHHLVLSLLREGEDGPAVGEALATADVLLEEVAQARRHVVGKPWLQAIQPQLRKVFASVGLHGESSTGAIEALHDTLQAIAQARPDLERALPELPRVSLPAAPEPEPVALDLGADVRTDAIDQADAERFRRMEIGTWLDFVDKDGRVQAGKLSWISPISSRLLFVNRRGIRFCVASPEELLVMERLGRLRPHEDDGAFDSAMQGVIDRLGPPSATLH
ncbi:DUF1631 domain-containing protein [Stenotrophomonas mori]|uniref:DUF1631 domain-containing protein n=1 Tax=Stenotrophomonas mori TaxID=2871096 RepID=A0ABT0SK07_9GAMM|nr:DUF1631 domain-containing protein [Stenotrophomonas mori]MCL7715665.1 DUF1631 domain-containing protein [Stenotrophomonas mori]